MTTWDMSLTAEDAYRRERLLDARYARERRERARAERRDPDAADMASAEPGPSDQCPSGRLRTEPSDRACAA